MRIKAQARTPSILSCSRRTDVWLGPQQNLGSKMWKSSTTGYLYWKIMGKIDINWQIGHQNCGVLMFCDSIIQHWSWKSWNSLQFIHSFYCNMGSDGGLQILFLGASCSKNTHVAAVAMQQKFGTFGLFSIDWKFHNHNWFSYFSEGQRGRYTTSQNRLNWRFD